MRRVTSPGATNAVGLGVESLSRATRSVRDLYNLLHELEEREKLLLSLKEQIDTSSATGRAFVGFVAIMNQLESDLGARVPRSVILGSPEKGLGARCSQVAEKANRDAVFIIRLTPMQIDPPTE
jgi:DNA invertase Pin-like site-specific DNA recombinase